MGIFALANTMLKGSSLILLLSMPAISFAQDKQMRSTDSNAGNSRAFWWGVDQSHWVSYLTLCDQGGISHDQLLKNYGDSEDRTEKRLIKYFASTEECLSSNDGSQ